MYVGGMNYASTAIVCLGIVSCAAVAQPIPDYGHTFMTVGAAGNRAATAAERNNAFDEGLNYGSVGYEYRITQTEVTANQWLEFVRAYAPFHAGEPGDFRFTGLYVDYIGNGQYVGGGQVPTDAGWQYAARYCNWLHNGKVNEAWAFESGAYDTATFTTNSDGTRNDQITHSSGARFWIPSFEETFKAFYYDPNRYGPGQDGYWMYPNSSNVAPVSGLPGEGTTNTGVWLSHGAGPWFDVGSYRDTQTPWGLLDASGGGREWLETPDGPYRRRYVVGTSFNSFADMVELWDSSGAPVFPDSPLGGWSFRVASVVPSPSAIGVAVFGISFVGVRRNR